MATIAAVIGAAASAYGAYSSSQAAKKQGQAAAGAAGALGGVPKAAEYRPVDLNQAQVDAVNGNFNALPSIESLINRVNPYITQDALQRANTLIPGYSQAMKQYGANTNALLAGRLPFNDVLGLVSDHNEAGAALGTPGAGFNATLKDLGISELNAMQTGGGMLGDMTRIAETISPRSTYMNPQQGFVDPTARIGIDLQQAQLEQQSQQNKNNLAAAPNAAAYFSSIGGAGQGNTSTASTAGGIANLAQSLLGAYNSASTQGKFGLNQGLDTSTGFYGSAGAASKAYGPGSNIAYYNSNGTRGYYNLGYSG